MTTMPPSPPDLSAVPATPATPSAWPTVIGIIAIVFGVMGMLGGCVGAVSTLMLDKLAGLMPEQQATGFEGVIAWKPWLGGLGVVGLLVAGLLTMGGIALLRRRPAAAGWCRAWSISKIIFVVANSAVGYMVHRAQFEAMMDDPNVAGMGQGFFSAIGIVGVVFGLLWGWALPIFLLIWFARPKIKEDMAAWAAADLPGLPAEPATWPPEPPVSP